MANTIPDETIKAIGNTVDIVEIVAESVVLKKAGKNYVGLCPFHSEKTPSFTVNPNKQIFYCFGCGAGGDVFSFVMKQAGMTFPDTARMLARRCGITISTPNMGPAQKRRMSERERLYALNGRAMDFYRHMLLNSAAGQKAREYLEKRGMTDQISASFKLGYAPAGWDNLVTFFAKRKVPRDLMLQSGLIVKKENSSRTWDRFRNRIVFPIFDSGGRVIGFGGRVMDDALPKYLNSPETPIYDKSRSLYGLHAARNSARAEKKVYIAEGYFDVLALHQHGISNAVATLGTSMTSEHVRLLKGIIGRTGRVILVYDSDAAGIKAARRSIEVFEKEYVDARILVLPSGHDPDSYLLEYGSVQFSEAAGRALGMMPFLMQSAITRHGLSVTGKIAVIDELVGALAAVDDGVARSLYIKELAEAIDVDELAILDRVRKTSAAVKNSGKSRPGDAAAATPSSGKAVAVKGIRLERQVVAMLLQCPEIRPEISRRQVLDRFEDTHLQSIGKMVLADGDLAVKRGAEARPVRQAADRGPAVMAPADESKTRRTIAELTIDDVHWDMAGCHKLLAQFELSWRRRENSLLKKIKAAEKSNDQVLLLQLLREKQNQVRSQATFKDSER